MNRQAIITALKARLALGCGVPAGREHALLVLRILERLEARYRR